MIFGISRCNLSTLRRQGMFQWNWIFRRPLNSRLIIRRIEKASEALCLIRKISMEEK